MKKEMIGDVPGNVLGMMADLCHKIQHGIILPEELGLFLQRKRPFSEKTGLSGQLETWQLFYKKYFGFDCDFSQVKIPERQSGFDRLIIVAKGLTLNQVYDVCDKRFPCWRYADDLDKAIPNNDRDPKNSVYAIWVRDRVEADEELKNLSADQLKEQGIIGITLFERMVYELKYWDETGKHLDQYNWTLCSGSRRSDGAVPSAYWYDCKFGVRWSYFDHHYAFLRSRAAVSS